MQPVLVRQSHIITYIDGFTHRRDLLFWLGKFTSLVSSFSQFFVACMTSTTWNRAWLFGMALWYIFLNYFRYHCLLHYEIANTWFLKNETSANYNTVHVDSRPLCSLSCSHSNSLYLGCQMMVEFAPFCSKRLFKFWLLVWCKQGWLSWVAIYRRG